MNQRIKKTVGKTITKSFFNEKWQELESQTNSDVTSYVWGLRYIDDLVLREKGKERLYSLADPNWNVVAICDTAGSVKERYTYDAFGKRNATEFDWNRAFTGQVLDVETGLMLYRERYYSTTLGRFVTRDPIGYEAGDMNNYRYVESRPQVYSDPLGLMPPKVPTSRYDENPATTGDGSWKFDKFLNTYCKGWDGVDCGPVATPQNRIDYGCGGIMSLRANGMKSGPQTVLNRKGASCFEDIGSANDYMRKQLAEQDGKDNPKKFLIIALQYGKSRPAFTCNPNTGAIMPGENQTLGATLNGPINYCSLLKTKNGTVCWEDATGPRESVVQKPTISGAGDVYSVYCVIPDTTLSSPVIDNEKLKKTCTKPK